MRYYTSKGKLLAEFFDVDFHSTSEQFKGLHKAASAGKIVEVLSRERMDD